MGYNYVVMITKTEILHSFWLENNSLNPLAVSIEILTFSAFLYFKCLRIFYFSSFLEHCCVNKVILKKFGVFSY